MAPEDPNDLPAGVPSPRSNTVIHVAVAIVASLPFLGLIGYMVSRCASEELGDTFGEIPIAKLDAPVEKPFDLAAGTGLSFGLSTNYQVTGSPAARLDVVLTRDGADVAETSCLMKSWGGSGRVASGGSTWYGDWGCKLEVPAGGAKGIRAKVRNTGRGSLIVTEAKVLVKK
ncbi:MAG: hypothetical protein IPM35_37180 [Myxococcales bacterium]|nr:hypothetical protein [Myxococcales bacterium]